MCLALRESLELLRTHAFLEAARRSNRSLWCGGTVRPQGTASSGLKAPLRHYKRVAECISAAENSVTEARMSASAAVSSKVPLPCIMIEPPKLVITVSDPDSGRSRLAPPGLKT